MSEKWCGDTKNILKALSKLKPKDRLAMCSALAKYNMAMVRSVNGWTVWLSDPRVLDRVSEEDLRMCLDEFEDIVKRFLALDMKITGKYVSEAEKKDRKKSVNPLVA